MRFRHVFASPQQFKVAVGRDLVQLRMVGIVPLEDRPGGQDGRQGKNAVLGREGGDGCGDVLPVEVAERQAGIPLAEVFEYGVSAVFLSDGSMS